MDPNDKEMLEQLGRDPFPRSGFDDRLRKRIEKRLDGDRYRRERRPRQISWRLPAAALVSFAAIVLGFWLWNGPFAGQSATGKTEDTLSPASVTQASPEPGAAPKKIAVLIGLRQDHENPGSYPVSTYRTLLVAPEEGSGRLSLTAELSGLYLPHKQDFWRISATDSPNGRQTLRAVQVTNYQKRKADAEPVVPDNLLSERVLFAGNEYVSLSSFHLGPAGGMYENRWVKRIEQINLKSADPSLEPHVPIRDVLLNAESVAQIEQWSVVRNPGKWMADLPGTSAANDKDLTGRLPVSVVNKDELLMSWADIQKIEPAAKDAFTYGNVLGTLTDKRIRVFTLQNGAALPESLSFPLKDGESLIMVQWAEGDVYVEKWIGQLRGLLGK